jgi:hypothetical protein
MSVETWKSVADWATIVLIALTVVSGSAALILGDRINEKQAEHLRKFDHELTDAKNGLSVQEQRAAEAESQLELVKKNTADTQVLVASANQKAAEADERAGQANEKAAEFNKSAEELRAKNLELEKLLLPRLVAIRGLGGGKTNIDPFVALFHPEHRGSFVFK